MQHIKQLLLLRSRGIGIKQSSRDLNLARNFVKKYLARCDELDHSRDELLSLAEPELLGLLEQEVRNPPVTGVLPFCLGFFIPALITRPSRIPRRLRRGRTLQKALRSG